MTLEQHWEDALVPSGIHNHPRVPTCLGGPKDPLDLIHQFIRHIHRGRQLPPWSLRSLQAERLPLSGGRYQDRGLSCSVQRYSESGRIGGRLFVWRRCARSGLGRRGRGIRTARTTRRYRTNSLELSEMNMQAAGYKKTADLLNDFPIAHFRKCPAMATAQEQISERSHAERIGA
jgi:hypothetical protein